jgi:hypothetical protein
MVATMTMTAAVVAATATTAVVQGQSYSPY